MAKVKNTEAAMMMRISLAGAQRGALRAWDTAERISRGNPEALPDIIGIWAAYGSKGIRAMEYLSLAANLRGADGRLMARLARAVSQDGSLNGDFEGFMRSHSRIFSAYAAESVVIAAHDLIGKFLESDMGTARQ